MESWEQLELVPLFDKLINAVNEWDPKVVLPRTVQLGILVRHQLDEYFEGKYRRDRNEVIGFAQTKLPISLDHFTQLAKDYKHRITPYPNYSGIVVIVPIDLGKVKNYSVSDIPNIDKSDKKDTNSSLKLM